MKNDPSPKKLLKSAFTLKLNFCTKQDKNKSFGHNFKVFRSSNQELHSFHLEMESPFHYF